MSPSVDNALLKLFHNYDEFDAGVLNSVQIKKLHQSLRIGGISMPQVLASISCSCDNRDYVTEHDVEKCLKEMDRRYYLIQDLQWEFSSLDLKHRGAINIADAKLLCKSVHGARFSESRWEKLLSIRTIPHADVTFAEIEVELCDIPDIYDGSPQITKNRKVVRPLCKTTEENITVNMVKVKPSAIPSNSSSISEIKGYDEQIKHNKKKESSKEKLKLDCNVKTKENSVDKMPTKSVGEATADPKTTKFIDELQISVLEGDLVRVTRAIKSFKEAGIVDSGRHLAAAERFVLMHSCKDEIQGAMRIRDFEKIDKGTDRAKRNNFHREELRDLVAHADEMSIRLRRLERLRHEVLELKQSTIAEIRSYSSPPPVVHNVMMATYVLLGTDEKSLKKWSNVQKLLGKIGRDGLKRRIMQFKIQDLTKETTERAKKFIGDADLEMIRDVSAGAATFFVWVDGMIEETCENL